MYELRNLRKNESIYMGDLHREISAKPRQGVCMCVIEGITHSCVWKCLHSER